MPFQKPVTRAAENILLAPVAHDQYYRILEEIYICRPFRNNTERLEKLFAMYAEMVKGEAA